MNKQYKVESYYYDLSEIINRLETTTDLSNESISTDCIQEENKLLKKVVDLSIQAYPGTKFKINGNDIPIIIGPSGIFQWKVLNNEGYIYSVVFDKLPFKMNQEQLRQINMIVIYGYYEE